MKTLLRSILTGGLITAGLVFLSGCSDDEVGPQLTGDSKTYELLPVSNPAISGTVTFAERDDDQVLVTIQLTGTDGNATYPAHIHANTAAAGGNIVISLSPVSGADGKSETVVSKLDDGTGIGYEDLLAFDGYVNVHLSESDLGTLVAQGDIGQNELTGDEKVYTFTPVIDPAVSGTATFAKRQNGKALITVALANTQPGTYKSHIHSNTIAEGGGIVLDLKSVDGTTGMAKTSIDTLNDGTPITYDELLNFNGYLNVHSGSSFLGQVDVGQNELTGDKKVYTLNEVQSSGVSGTATFEKRKSGKTLVTLSLQGTTAGGDHPAHIHANSVASGTGGIVLDLKNVKGDTGKSLTSANALNDGTAITYDGLLGYNGHINVHKSPTELGILIAQGDIGSNAP